MSNDYELEQKEIEKLIAELQEVINDGYPYSPKLPIVIHDLDTVKYFGEIKSIKKLIREIKKHRFNLKYYTERINELAKHNYSIEIFTNSGLYSLNHKLDSGMDYSQLSTRDVKMFLFMLYGFNEGLKAKRRTD